jgi:hypothetical protein
MADEGDDTSISMSSAKFDQPNDLALVVAAQQRLNRITMLGFGVVGLLLGIALLGVFIWSGSVQTNMKSQQDLSLQAMQAAVAMTKKICEVDTLYLFSKYCDASLPDARQQLCYDMISGVERYIDLRNKTAIFDAMKALEPQTGAINYWAVDEDTLNEDSHLDQYTNDVVAYFNSTAYYYAQKVHMEAVPCGGWSQSYWRNLNGVVDLDLVYCEHVSPQTGANSDETSVGIRVCGAFKLSSFNVTK